jgi:hypothetical protein
MKKLTLLLLSIAIGVVGCDKGAKTAAPSKPTSTVVHLDDAHNHSPGANNTDIYTIAPSPSLEVSADGYKIPVPTNSQAAVPNAIHIIHGNDEYFRAAWDGKTPVVLTAENLKNIRGSKNFSGFEAGENYVLGVGHDNFPDSDMKFVVMWVGMIKVNPAQQTTGH